MKLLGPVFWYELNQVARRQHLALTRAVFALLLLVALFLNYSSSFQHLGLLDGGIVARSQLSRIAGFATEVFYSFTILQFAAVVLFIPALTANALAEERSHDTLTFLLTTQLTSREIILGKLFTRLMQIGMIVLTALPILFLLQLFGGVHPGLIMAGLAGTGVTALSLGSLGLVCAIYVKKPQRAAWRACQIVIAYGILSTGLIWGYDLPAARNLVWTVPPSAANVPPRQGPTTFSMVFTMTANWVPTTQDIVLDWVNVANPVYAAKRMERMMAPDTDLTEVILPGLRDYAIVHGLLTVAFLTLAISRLRAVSSRQVAGMVQMKSIYLKPSPHPPIKDRPVYWKEYYCESKPRQRWAAMLFNKWFFYASFLPAWIFIVLALDGSSSSYRLGTWVMLALRYGGTVVAGGLLLRIGTQAARSISGERDRMTLDSLLATELTADEIIRDKWWGCLVSGRWVLLWLIIHWALGVLSMALGPLAALLLIAEVIVFAAFMTSLGLYFSVRATTTKSALRWTILVTLIGTVAAPWIIGQLLAWVGLNTEFELSRRAYYYGDPVSFPPSSLASMWLSPIRMLVETVSPHPLWSSDYFWNHPDGRDRWYSDFLPTVAVGLAFYSILTIGLQIKAQRRFRLIRNGMIPNKTPSVDA